MIIAMQTHGRLEHLANGIHNDAVVILEEGQRTHPTADLHIFWGYRSYLDSGLPAGRPYLICDKGFVRRPSVMVALSGDWGGLANWPDVEPRKVQIPEWEWTSAKKALILGQDPHDFSTKAAVKNFNKWKFDMTDELVTQGWEVRFREHPRVLMEAPRDIQRPPLLSEDLRDVGLVVGLNSGALVEAFLAGYPVHAADEHSLVHPFSVDLKKVDQSEPEGREAFFNRLGGLSWTYAELADGRCWEALRDQVLELPEVPQASTPARSARTTSRKKAANA